MIHINIAKYSVCVCMYVYMYDMPIRITIISQYYDNAWENYKNWKIRNPTRIVLILKLASNLADC